MRILVADDERKLREILYDFLTEEGFDVVLAEDGRDALNKYNEGGIDLLILDVMMPFMDGWQVCKAIRKTSRVPIIMLTARSEEADELESFEKGANDYIPKPFSLAVLRARVYARLSKGESDRVSEGELVINLETHEVELAGKLIDLTPTEYELLLHLVRNKGKLYTRAQLLTLVWGYDYYGGDRTVDTHVGRLRIKLGEYGNKYIKTVRGYGYRFSAEG